MNILWIKDGKKGHEKQVKALLEEIIKTADIKIYEENYHINTLQRFIDIINYAFSYFFRTNNHHKILNKYSENNIDIVIGAGTNIHARMLLLKKAFNKKIIVISVLTPSFFKNNFDFICAPKHDAEKLNNYKNVILFEGSLAKVSTLNTDNKVGLIGLGGLNKHFVFNEDDLIKQIEYVLSLYQEKNWHLYVSRRTPESMIQKIELLSKSFLNLIIANNDFDALLQKASIKFISQDSMNMIYESLSTSGKTFLFNMKIKNDNKVTRQIERLQKNKQIGYIENIAISEDIRKIKILPQNDYTNVFAEVEKVSFQLINKLNSTLK